MAPIAPRITCGRVRRKGGGPARRLLLAEGMALPKARRNRRAGSARQVDALAIGRAGARRVELHGAAPPRKRSSRAIRSEAVSATLVREQNAACKADLSTPSTVRAGVANCSAARMTYRLPTSKGYPQSMAKPP